MPSIATGALARAELERLVSWLSWRSGHVGGLEKGRMG